MYNGIGLQTVRGSATSGHVQKNMSHIKPEFFRNRLEANVNRSRDADIASGKGRGAKANPEILEHIRKREIEAKIYAARDELETMGYTEEEINERLSELRAEITRDSKSMVSKAKDTHSIATRKDSENEKAKRAFGITGDFNEGDSFNRDVQEQRRQDRLREREEKEVAWQKRKAEEAERREANQLRREQIAKEREEERKKRAERGSRSRSRSGGRFRRSGYRSRDTARDKSDRWALEDGYDRRDRATRRRGRSFSRSWSRDRSRSRDRGRRRRDERSRSRSVSRSSRSSSRSSSSSSSRSRSRSRSRSPSEARKEYARAVKAPIPVDDRTVPNPSMHPASREETVDIGQQLRPGGRKSRFSSATSAPADVPRESVAPPASPKEEVAQKRKSRSRSASASSSSSSGSSSSSSSSSGSGSSRSSRSSRSRSSRSSSSSVLSQRDKKRIRKN